MTNDWMIRSRCSASSTEIGVGVAEAGPVDVESANHRVGEVVRDVRCHRLGMRVRPPGFDEQAEVFVLRQPLERGGDALRDRIGGVGEAPQMCGQPVEEAAYSVHGGRHEEGVRAGEIPVHRLAGDAERASHVGDGEVRAAGVDRLACGVEDPRDGFVVAGGR